MWIVVCLCVSPAQGVPCLLSHANWDSMPCWRISPRGERSEETCWSIYSWGCIAIFFFTHDALNRSYFQNWIQSGLKSQRLHEHCCAHYEWTDKWRHFKPSLFLFFFFFSLHRFKITAPNFIICLLPPLLPPMSLSGLSDFESVLGGTKTWGQDVSRGIKDVYTEIWDFFFIKAVKKWIVSEKILICFFKFPQSKERFLSSSSGFNPVPLKSCLCKILFKPHTTAGDFTD